MVEDSDGLNWAFTNTQSEQARNVVAEKRTADLQPEMFEAHLLSAVSGWLTAEQKISALGCGMAGARNRWQETPFEAAQRLTIAPTQDKRLSAYILPVWCACPVRIPNGYG